MGSTGKFKAFTCTVGLTVLFVGNHTACLGADTDPAGPIDTAALDINGVMRHAMTKGLCQKVIKQKASPEETALLSDLFKRLAELPPPKGSPESWKKLTDQLVQASGAVAEGKPEHKKLRKAANCVLCHREHRPK